MLRILGWAFVAVSALVLVMPHALPLISGHRLLIVDGGSMAPTFLAGDVLITRPASGDDLHLDRVLVVGTPPTSYTHRVIEVHGEGTERRARLRGDANQVADPLWVKQAEVSALPVATISGRRADAVRFGTQRPGTVLIAGTLLLTLALLLRPRSD